MKTNGFKTILIILSLCCLAGNASADWVLNNNESTLNFISIKKSKVGEVHHFKKFEGLLKENGEVSVTVKLNSVETNIPIRNDRMQQFLFEVTQFPVARVDTTIDSKEIKKLKVGDSFLKKMSFDISIHGHDQTLLVDVRVILLTGKKLLVSTMNPIILNIGEFSLIKGVEKLKELAKLPSISTAVPVTAHFVFQKED